MQDHPKLRSARDQRRGAGPSVPAALLACVVFAACITGCARAFVPVYVPDGGRLTLAQAEGLADQTDVSDVAGIDIEHAPDARTDVLIWLRRQGTLGDRAATLLTRGFPDRTAAVPLLVEIAEVDGVRSLIVVEAFGGPSGPLTARRVWRFDLESGDLLGSTTVP